MALYAIVKNNNIEALYDDVPTVLGNLVSGFHLLSEEERAAYGFVPVVQEVDEFDPEIHDIVEEKHVVVKGVPTFIRKVKDRYTPEELLENKKQAFMNNLRSTRDYLLGKSDWTMQADVVEVKGQEFYDAWKEYRQYLRDLPLGDYSSIDYDFSRLVIRGEPTL